MGRLIDAEQTKLMLSELLEVAEKENFTAEDAIEHACVWIDRLPTAYDVEKVVSEIHKKHCQKCRNILGVAGAEEYCKSVNCDIGIICDIVKRGGVE